MKIFSTYSKRRRGLPDVFVYNRMPEKLKTQIYYIWSDYISQVCFEEDLRKATYERIRDQIRREEGKRKLYIDGMYSNLAPSYEVERYFENLDESNEEDIERALDAIEITFTWMTRLEQIKRENTYQPNIIYPIERAIEDLNQRFRENGIGYEYANSQIIRIDNQILHRETVQQAIKLLNEPKYQNVNSEYMNAHKHYRHRRNHECLNECLKAFESVMKVVISKNGWTYEENYTSKKLINVLLSNNFFPKYHESQLSALRQQLESSVPTIRNKNSGHGSGSRKTIVLDGLANYMLYTTGATIRLVVETQLEYDKLKNSPQN